MTDAKRAKEAMQTPWLSEADGLYCEEHEALHCGDRVSSKRGYNRHWLKARARYLKV